MSVHLERFQAVVVLDENKGAGDAADAVPALGTR